MYKRQQDGPDVRSHRYRRQTGSHLRGGGVGGLSEKGEGIKKYELIVTS